MISLRSCGVLVVRKEPKPGFLLLRHPKRWDLPKGHVDPGESDMVCAMRELREETGILPEDIRVDPEFRYSLEYTVREARHNFAAARKTLVIFLAYLLRPVKIVLTEHDDSRWFEWNPPHKIQRKTIDPVLAAVEAYLEGEKARGAF
jgi:8-oxo-dGTP pyrophosphatase MutT (NUDIX family)